MKDLSGPKETQNTPKTEKTERVIRKHLAQATGGTSPAAMGIMVHDWWLHLAAAPDKQIALAQQAQDSWLKWLRYVSSGCPSEASKKPIEAKSSDRRFRSEAWETPAFAALSQAFLLAEDLADQATTDVPGLSPEHDRAMTFLVRQMMDAMAPSNFLPTNPEALERTLASQGANLVKGSKAFFRDVQAALTGQTEAPSHELGKDLATTKGKVVLRTHLMELIQYEPVTDKVHPEPVLLIPAWIMKYYILDLSPENSMVRYLTEQGFTVYMVSWRNPSAEDAELGMSDYLEQGPMAALDHIQEASGGAKVHAAGYCLGGTLLSIAAAALARDGRDALASMTLLAAQTDFAEAGELTLFINESQVSFLEDVMSAQGYLDASQMMSAFQMLRSNDLIWSRMIRSYLLGEDDLPMNDLMAWNADSTRMPARMHSQYLRHMFLNNDLAAGRYVVDGHPVSLRDIRLPVFGVGTESDHIAPWKSVYKIHNLGHADITFALTNGGHNAGVVSEPGHKRRHFRLHSARDSDKALTPEDWQEVATLHEGSWWPAWTAWLAARSGAKIAPPQIKRALCDAPGTYVRMG